MTVWKIPREQKKVLIERVQSYFELERDESIGELAAEHLLDFLITAIGPTLYNQAIRDARKVAMAQMVRVEEEIDLLEKPEERAR
ncbi:DUF2164 domain-containing protein [Alicyclobacillus sp. ALC3]|uniref:DUF2164 domain-containing protein n=1 Tax=Alicyclobacillus sp. ALC3 TaxID=2796143 RepID=UPI0023797FEA|nr:DUF2164 domain-containing protein [Alicyclobacillus sp. ALC3]WDL95116.1 DUF2164 domain-containing protein [Alicyclobacillus sp. ALC3]